MNGRPKWPMLVFALCAVAVLVALGYVTAHALRLERRELAAQQRAAVEEAARLALWRMDSAMAPLIARESARPYFHYAPFYAAGRAYTNMWEEVRPGEVLIPSPLLTVDDPLIRLHFQLSPAGELTSPQAPTGNMRDQVEAAYLPPQRVMQAEQSLLELAAVLGDGSAAFAAMIVDRTHEDVFHDAAQAPPPPSRRRADTPAKAAADAEAEFAARRQVQVLAGAGEQNRRGASPHPQAPQRLETEAADMLAVPAASPVDAPAAQRLDAVAEAHDLSYGEMRALWRAGPASDAAALLLVRILLADGNPVAIQGVWLDWPAVRTWLAAQVQDTFPGATVEALSDDHAGIDLSRRLASIPARLQVGPAAGFGGGVWQGAAGGVGGAGGWTPMRTTLAISWLAALAAIALTAVALRSAADLATRRGRFVSAVTHELRTPLTTFCLYTQMLSDGVVADEPTRRQYLATLRGESQRLARVVENVLEFARLGRKRQKPGAQPAHVGEMLERIVPRLQERARQADVDLRVQMEPGAESARVGADVHAVEQVLTNLVENACRYGTSNGQPPDQPHHQHEVVLRIERSGPAGRLAMSVQDAGPGIPAADQRRLFRPFHRGTSLEHAATPGLGLGLALSRGLARQHRGDLVLTRTGPDGTVFTLWLPTL